MERRKFLARAGQTATGAALASLAGCSSIDRLTGGGGSQELALAFQAPAETTDINTWYGAREIAPEEQGLETTVKVFEGVDLAVQSVLAGETSIARGSVTAAATVVESGKPFEFLIAPLRSTDYVLVTRPEIDSLEAIVEEDAVIGMSAPTGLDAVQVAALMFENDVIDDVSELNFQRVGYSSARRGALLQGDIDVSPQHYAQWLSMREEDPDLNKLAEFGAQLDDWIQETFMAPAEVVERNRESVVAFFAAQLEANRRLYGDYENYRRLVQTYVPGGGPDEEILRPTYDFLTDIEIWPRNGGLTEANVDYMLDLSDRVGLTDERIPTDEVTNRGPLEDALSEVGRV
jgi:ABC-type nitrate/sulfonate/bicarbonate transport system substrate-binding protein